MSLNVTHTFVKLEVSAATYNEIAHKLNTAGYAHVFIYQDEGPPLINMHGIGLQLNSSLDGKKPTVTPKKE